MMMSRFFKGGPSVDTVEIPFKSFHTLTIWHQIFTNVKFLLVYKIWHLFSTATQTRLNYFWFSVFGCLPIQNLFENGEKLFRWHKISFSIFIFNFFHYLSLYVYLFMEKDLNLQSPNFLGCLFFLSSLNTKGIENFPIYFLWKGTDSIYSYMPFRIIVSRVCCEQLVCVYKG